MLIFTIYENPEEVFQFWYNISCFLDRTTFNTDKHKCTCIVTYKCHAKKHMDFDKLIYKKKIINLVPLVLIEIYTFKYIITNIYNKKNIIEVYIGTNKFKFSNYFALCQYNGQDTKFLQYVKYKEHRIHDNNIITILSENKTKITNRYLKSGNGYENILIPCDCIF